MNNNEAKMKTIKASELKAGDCIKIGDRSGQVHRVITNGTRWMIDLNWCITYADDNDVIYIAD